MGTPTARTLSKVEGEAPKENAFVFAAPRVALRTSLRQQGMKIHPSATFTPATTPSCWIKRDSLRACRSENPQTVGFADCKESEWESMLKF
jgi:hypothetical protein